MKFHLMTVPMKILLFIIGVNNKIYGVVMIIYKYDSFKTKNFLIRQISKNL